jgi:uncharacterized membrane protein YqgA involved in biofilm formation
MLFIGTTVNGVLIVAGALVGIFIRRGISPRFKRIIENSVGISVVLIGVSGTMVGMLTLGEGAALERTYIMTLVIAMILGGIIGEAINFEGWFHKAGQKLMTLLPKKGSDDAPGGFATATILFCVGAMAVVGAMEEALLGDPSTILAKGVIDGVMAAVLASAMGIGVAFSAIPVFIYQSTISLLAGFISPIVTDAVLAQMSLVGSAIIMGIGLNMLKVTKIPVGNLLPATFIPFLWSIFTKFF